MTFTEITESFSVAPQIRPDDVQEIAALGFRSIMCNRPDGEAPGQPAAADIRAEAARHGLAFAFLPVVSGRIEEDDVEAFRAAIGEIPGPVLAYCRSGTRCQNLWMLVQR